MRLGHLGGWDVRKLPLTTAEVSEGGVTAIEVPGFATVRTNPFTGEPEASASSAADTSGCRTRTTPTS